MAQVICQWRTSELKEIVIEHDEEYDDEYDYVS